MRRLRIVFILTAVLLVFHIALSFQAAPPIVVQRDVNSFLLGMITVLIAIVGYLTKRAYEETDKKIVEMGKTISRMDRRLVRAETTLKISEDSSSSG